MMKRAVLYARVSGDDRGNEGRNLSSQLDICREFALTRGYTVVAELSEDERGASGADFELPKLQETLEMARQGAFDVLVVRELDRLARSLAKQLFVEEEFQKAGVSIEYALASYDESPEGNFMKNVRAVVAEYERLKISERMVRGRRNKVKAGSVNVQGRPPFGYNVVERDGKYLLEINDSEAQVVRNIFAWYTEGDGVNGSLGTYKIACKLTDMGIPTYADRRPEQKVKKQNASGVWVSSSVLGILSNETYAGVWHYGKRSDAAEPIAVEVPAIVSREVWEATQAQKSKNRTNAKRNRKNQYLIGRRVVCGRCGYKMYGTSAWASRGKPRYLYYGCPAHYKKESLRTCDMPPFRAEEVDEAVWEWIQEKVFDPGELARGLEKQRAAQKDELAPVRERVKALDGQLAEQGSQLGRLLDLYLAGEFPREILVERKARLERAIAALEEERDALVLRLETETLTRQEIQTLQDFVARIAEGWGVAEDTFETRRHVIEMIDLQATLLMDEEGVRRVHARCRLGSGTFRVAPKGTHGYKGQNTFALTARLILSTTRRGEENTREEHTTMVLYEARFA